MLDRGGPAQRMAVQCPGLVLYSGRIDGEGLRRTVHMGFERAEPVRLNPVLAFHSRVEGRDHRRKSNG